MIDPTALAELRKATRDCTAWSMDPTQINFKVNPAKEPYLFNAFRALAWLTRETYNELLARLLEEEIEYRAAHTATFAPQVNVPRKVARVERPEGSLTLDELADYVMGESETL